MLGALEDLAVRFEKTGALVKFKNLRWGSYFVWSVVGGAVSIKVDTTTYVDLEDGMTTGLPRDVPAANMDAACLGVRAIIGEGS